MPVQSETVTTTTFWLRCNLCKVAPFDLAFGSVENRFKTREAALEAAHAFGWEIDGDVLTCPVCILCRDTKITWRFAGPGFERKDAK